MTDRSLTIDRKLDPIAITALILALLSATAQFYNYVRGEKIESVQSSQVLMKMEELGSLIYLRIGMQVSYLNSAPKGYDGIVLEEWMEFEIDKIIRRQESINEIFYYIDGEKLKIDRIGPSKPLVIEGASASSREILFSPNISSCRKLHDYENCDDLITLKKFNIYSKDFEKLEFYTYSKILGRKEPLKVKCTVKFDQPERVALTLSGWMVLPCINK